MRRLAIVIVTYKRQGLLAELFDSILELTTAPWRVVVVDNENSGETARLVAGFAERLDAQWPPADDDPDAEGGPSRVVYDPMEENTGGSGGFSEGVRRAFELGAEWFWVMDDDVAVLPDGLETLERWSGEADAIMGQRRDFDDGHFFWQHRFWPRLAIYNPLSRDGWRAGERYKLCNALCFEGGFFSRGVVEKIGLPDARFFIYLDDALYGYLASKVHGRLLRAGLRALAAARGGKPGDWFGAPAQLHLGHDALLHHAQPWLPGPLLHALRRVQPGGLCRGHGAHLCQGAHTPARGRPRAPLLGHAPACCGASRRAEDPPRPLLGADAAACIGDLDAVYRAPRALCRVLAGGPNASVPRAVQ